MTQANLKVSKKTVITLFVLVILIFMGSAAGYYAISKQISIASAEFAEKQKRVDAAQETAKDLDYAKLDYQDVLSQIKSLETGVTNKTYVPTLLKQIETLGKSTHLQVVAINPTRKENSAVINPLSVIKVMYKDKARMQKIVAEKEKSNKKSSSSKSSTNIDKPYDQIFIDITVQGKYVNVLNFLYRLTNFPKIISVDSIGLSPNQESTTMNINVSNNSPELRANLKLSAYLMKEEIKTLENQKTIVSSNGNIQVAQGGIR